MIERQLTWIGLSVDDYIIDSELADGSFSWVYTGFNKDGRGKAAFKVAKPPDLIRSPENEQTSLTQAIAIWSGFTQKIHPDAQQLLLLQAQKLSEANDSGLIKVEDSHIENNFAYLRLELVEGQTLRKVMNSGFVQLDILIEIASIMSRLEMQNDWQHGNLTPENIIVGNDGVKIIDPGYFGPLNSLEGQNLRCAVTTVAYYPFLTPNDIFAFGAMLWEIVTKRHPLLYNDSDTDDNSHNPNLTNWVEKYQSAGQYFLSPILKIKRPSELIPNFPAKLEEFLLRSLQLRVNKDKTVDKDDGFSDFSQLKNELQNLLNSGIRQL